VLEDPVTALWARLWVLRAAMPRAVGADAPTSGHPPVCRVPAGRPQANAGGTGEIQRDMPAERVLGMAR
jgi:hypothetical protein